MPSYVLEAFFLGLSTGPVCLAYCAPVVAPLVMAQEKFRLPRLALLLGIFLGGRLAGYLAIGFLVGLFSQTLAAGSHSRVAGGVTLFMGAALLVFGFLKNFPTLKWCRRFPVRDSSLFWVLALGLLTGLNICPPFVAAITGSATLGSISGALLYFAAFFLGTSVYVPPLLLLGPLSNRPAIQTVAKICLLLSGAWFMIKGMILLL